MQNTILVRWFLRSPCQSEPQPVQFLFLQAFKKCFNASEFLFFVVFLNNRTDDIRLSSLLNLAAEKLIQALHE